jgi:hypothetical protein
LELWMLMNISSVDGYTITKNKVCGHTSAPWSVLGTLSNINTCLNVSNVEHWSRRGQCPHPGQTLRAGTSFSGSLCCRTDYTLESCHWVQAYRITIVTPNPAPTVQFYWNIHIVSTVGNHFFSRGKNCMAFSFCW